MTTKIIIAIIITNMAEKKIFPTIEGTPKSSAKLINAELAIPKLPKTIEITLKVALNVVVKVDTVDKPSPLAVAFCI